MAQYKQFSFKKFGALEIGGNATDSPNHPDYQDFIKIIFLKAGSCITVDFQDYLLEQDALFFVNAGQWYNLDEPVCQGQMLFYNRDFYCVEIHDREVACDGILFHNVYEIPVVWLNAASSAAIQQLLQEINQELLLNDSSMEEMLRILLKQIIIRCTRIWKQAHEAGGEAAGEEIEFSRKFSQLVEWHYTRYHSVAEYASLLNMTPKALNKRVTRYSQSTPNDIIKNRIILEAKRLLAHTDLSVKEIAYKLGYEDPAYFIRLFTKHTDLPPQHFRRQYKQSAQAI